MNPLTFTISATYGGSQTPCEVFVYLTPRGGAWYAVEGSHNVNLAPDADLLEHGVDVETIPDEDTFTAGRAINSERDLEEQVDGEDDEPHTSENWTVTIETGNAAFQESPTGEIARILRGLADRLEADGLPPERLFDVNGQGVGRVEVEST